MKYMRIPQYVEVTVWHKLGDHPEVEKLDVSRFDVSDTELCTCLKKLNGETCGRPMSEHGFLSTSESDGKSNIVCPGDFIVEYDSGYIRVEMPDAFSKQWIMVQ